MEKENPWDKPCKTGRKQIEEKPWNAYLGSFDFMKNMQKREKLDNYGGHESENKFLG